jgi:acyl-CoA thioesterase
MNKPLLELIRNRYFEDRSRPLFEHALNPTLKTLEPGVAEVLIIVNEPLQNAQGMAHGGALATLCDLAMGLACVTMGKMVVTTDLSISYLRAAKVGQTLIARGEIVKDGKNLMRAMTRVDDNEGNLIVDARATFFVTGVLSSDIGHSIGI